jgi:hypothetical protein
MKRRVAVPAHSNATVLDLRSHSEALAKMLPALLFRRDRPALMRWCQVRSWVDNALDGETGPDVATIDLAVAYLSERASGRGGT